MGPGESHIIGLAMAIQPAHTGQVYSPKLFNLPDVVLDQSPDGLIAITWMEETDRYNKESG